MSLRALPMIAIPLILYNILVMFSSGDADSFFHAPLLTISMIKGAQWSFSRGDLIILVTMLCLFVELVKSTYTSTASLVDHGLSMLVFIASLVEFLIVNRCRPAGCAVGLGGLGHCAIPMDGTEESLIRPGAVRSVFGLDRAHCVAITDNR